LFYIIDCVLIIMKKIKKETQLVRIDCEIKHQLDNMIQVKGETYSDIIKRIIELNT